LKRVAIIGSTGSIGTQTLDVIQSEYGRFRVVALSAHTNDSLLAEQVNRFGPQLVCMYDREGASRLKTRIKNVTILTGDEGLNEIATLNIDLLVVAGSGSSCISPTLKALERGTKIALATKEVIVCGAHLIEQRFFEELVVPIDSEPSAIFQCLQGDDRTRIREILLTASGGPFFSKNLNWGQLSNVRPEEALSHPRWRMGKKISIDSATLVNKGLEIIEISKLFDIPHEKIRVLLHPSAEIHSGVTFVDGSTKLLCSPPDMRYPISFALHYPARSMSDLKGLHLPANWTLQELPETMSRSIDLARKAIDLGPSGLVSFAAADEAAVEMFLSKQLPFVLIPEIISKSLTQNLDVSTISKVLSNYNAIKTKAFDIGRRLCQSF